jgi:SPP1 gp7 family putative phage head morphogenesis protein
MADTANTLLYDKQVDRAAMIRLYEKRLNGKVELVLNGHAVRVDQLIKEAEASPKGLIKLRDAVDKELMGTYKEVHGITRRGLLDLARAQFSYGVQIMDLAVGQILRPQRPSRRVAEEIVLKRPLANDMTLAEGWTNVSLAERKKLELLLRRGIAQGKTADELAVMVRKGNVHKISLNQSRALVVTAMTSVYAQADHEVYKANEKAILGWQYVAVLDTRTTPICRHRDGTIYPVGDVVHLPPAHFNCRSTTTPVFKSWEQMGEIDSLAGIRKRNLSKLSAEQKAYYDGNTPLRESYDTWLRRQDLKTQLKHLGNYQRVDMFNRNALTVDKFVAPTGASLGIRELRAMTDDYVVPGDTRKFADAKEKLDAMRLTATEPEDFFNDPELFNTLTDYYLLQAGELNGNLALVNYRGTLIHNKRATRNRVLNSPPTEQQLVYNPLTGRHDDARMYQPNPEVYSGALRRINDSTILQARDKEVIHTILSKLDGQMSMNQRAVIADNLRVIFTRFRQNGEPWGNLKAVIQGQLKFDIMNISDAIETQIRKDKDPLKKLLDDDYLDPVLGRTQIEFLGDNFAKHIIERNKWEDTVAPKIARELRSAFDLQIPLKIRSRLTEDEIKQFYLRFAMRLAAGGIPDRDSLAISLGRDLYNMANRNGKRNDWYKLGRKILEKEANHLFEIDTYGVQRRRMRSRMSGQYFGPYYDTTMYYLDITDPRLIRYNKLNRMIDVGKNIPVRDPINQLHVREGYRTYFLKKGKFWYDTRDLVASDSHFRTDWFDKEGVDALNWAMNAKYKIDEDFFDFVWKLLYFKDDRGKAAYYDDLNHYRKYLLSRGDTYEHFKTMDYLRQNEKAFSNHVYLDHRGRIYSRGYISPMSGETFRPFLNTAHQQNLGVEGYGALNDQIGSFLGGLADYFEGEHDSLTFLGRQEIAKRLRPQMIAIGHAMIRGKPADIRYILEHEAVHQIDGEELGKFLRFALEVAKIDDYLGSDYSDLRRLNSYKTSLGMEQDASSSGAQIIALTTRNKQLAGISNVIPTNNKKRLYDEIALATYNDPRFRELNKRLGLSLRDLQGAAKAQNMVTFYGAGERTGILNVERKLAKPLGLKGETLVITAGERDTVLSEISAQIARIERFDPLAAEDLRALRDNVKDIFNKGATPSDEIMDQLWFLNPRTKSVVDRLTAEYDNIVTPDDFKSVAKIFSEYLAEEAPIIRDFTKFFGRMAVDFLKNSKPSKAALDWETLAKGKLIGFKGKDRKKGYILPNAVSELLGLKPGEPVSEKVLKTFSFYKPDSSLSEMIYGVGAPGDRTVGKKYLELKIAGKTIFPGVEIGVAKLNKIPPDWTTVPWVNFEGKVLEQPFTQAFEERLVYKNADGTWAVNIVNVPQKTRISWWDEFSDKEGKINDIADATRAMTAYAVNGNHSNDAVIVKKFHLWGRRNNIETATVHDAFFTNIADLMPGRRALRGIYAETLKNNVFVMVLDEMLARGLPREVYDKYMQEAIEKGLIPVPGKSVIGGKVLTEDDILKPEDILREVPYGFEQNYGWYGVG